MSRGIAELEARAGELLRTSESATSATPRARGRARRERGGSLREADSHRERAHAPRLACGRGDAVEAARSRRRPPSRGSRRCSSSSATIEGVSEGAHAPAPRGRPRPGAARHGGGCARGAGALPRRARGLARRGRRRSCWWRTATRSSARSSGCAAWNRPRHADRSERDRRRSAARDARGRRACCGGASELVRCEARFRPLVERLLGSVVVVEDRDDRGATLDAVRGRPALREPRRRGVGARPGARRLDAQSGRTCCTARWRSESSPGALAEQRLAIEGRAARARGISKRNAPTIWHGRPRRTPRWKRAATPSRR